MLTWRFGDEVFHSLQATAVKQRFLVGQVLLRANARNLGGCIEQGVGHLAGHHVDLVTVGDGNQHIGVFGTCFEQCVGVRGLARDGADVQPVLQQAQLFPVDVHHRDVILFVSQVFGERTADLAGAENNDFHSSGSSTCVMGLEYPSTLKKSPVDCKCSPTGIMHIVSLGRAQAIFCRRA